MMNQQPDNFFQEKLKNYQKPVPAAAWNKIEARMQKKTDPRVWLKFAASLLLLLGIGCTIWIINSKTSKQPLTYIKELHPVLPENNIKKVDPGVSAPPPEIKEQPTENNNIAKGQATTTKVILQLKKLPPTSAPLVEMEPEKDAKEDDAIPVTPPVEGRANADSPNVVPVKKTSTVTLTFTTEETNQYLNKNALAEATQDEKKSSTFKKLLQKASDLKSNQDPFGDLREKKNEILALNFKNEKRGQNK